jgi:acyl-CoA synthetase (AMP-forming)/AMP-acid ligase II/alkylation response protein AidB-like acyl-CoA dehydrogenase/acyl carrier protein
MTEQFHGEIETGCEFLTAIDLLRHQSRYQASKTAFQFLQDGEVEAGHLTFQQLDQQARAIAIHLTHRVVPGERALLLYPPGLEFIAAFFGCLYAGVTAVPVYPPRANQNMLRLQAIVADAGASVALTTTTTGLTTRMQEPEYHNTDLAALHWLDTDNLDFSPADQWRSPSINGETLAFLQYTSGSTGKPKGVMVSHRNLLCNERMICEAFGHDQRTIFAGWLPVFHDMGLIGNLLQPLYLGISCYLMSPVAFLQKPIRWLQTISRYQATTSGGPNFAYDLCLRKITPEMCEGLDLSSWQVAFNGAEPVRAETLERFTETFAPYGFRREAWYPCYGMAETTLFVSGGVSTSPPIVYAVDATALKHNRVIPADPYAQSTRRLVGCGRVWQEEKIAIVDPESRQQCASNQVGEIWVSSLSVAQGYWQRLETTAQTFHAYIANTGEGPFLRTGDLGFLQDGELFVTGRIKDVIIIRGRNHYPQDIEVTIEESHSALRPGAGAAFSVEVDGEEQLVIVQEVERTQIRKLNVEEIAQAIRQAVSQHHELQVHAIALLKTGSVPKTSSGKIQRHACRQGYLQSDLSVVGVWPAPPIAPAAPPVDLPLATVASLNNLLYGAARVHPLPLIRAIAPTSSDVATQSHQRAEALLQWLRDYGDHRINSYLIDQRRCIPPHVVLDFGNRGVLGMQVSEQYGGLNLTTHDTLRVVAQLAAIDLNLASFVGVNHALGTRPILNYANLEVKQQLLPLIAHGTELAAFAITEPAAGSNPRAIATTATPDGQGGWRLNGQKIWIGSGSWAGMINVFVQLQGDHQQPLGITGFVVRQGTKGLRQGAEALTMGMRGMVQNQIHLENVSVTPEMMLGEPGQGMMVAQDAMMFGRLGIAAMSVGGMKRCAQLMLRYGERRSILTGRLLDNPVTLCRLHELTAAITTVETLIFRIANLLDAGESIPAEAYAVCKTAAPELFWNAVDHLVQLLGGRGYIEPNIAPQLLRDARLLRIFEGPTEALNLYLGSRLLNNQGADLYQFMTQQLNAPQVVQQLQDAVERIRDRWIGEQSPTTDAILAMRWASVLVGEVATAATLLAAVQGEQPTNSLRSAEAWARQQLEQILTKALAGMSVAVSWSDADATRERIRGYVEAIGDGEQSLAGEDRELDELLQQHPTKDIEFKRQRGDASLPKVTAQSIETESIQQEPKPENSQISNSLKPDQRIKSIAPVINTVDVVQTWIVEWLARKLRLPVNQIDVSKSFAVYGIDSVMAVDLSFELGEWLQQSLDATILWNFPTIAALAQHLTRNQPQTTPQIPEPLVLTSSQPVLPTIPAALPENLESLSDVEMAELLMQEIAAAQSRYS